VDVLAASARGRLAAYGAGRAGSPLPGFWTEAEVAPGSA
jgi:hypothetical protein